MKKLSLVRRVGGVIRRRREALGFSQEAFADHIQMHRTYYGAIERGEKNLQLTTLERVCAGLTTAMADLLREVETAGSDEPPRSAVRKSPSGQGSLSNATVRKP